MDFELVASIVAMFIALCALSVSIWQGMETRKNYRISVKPFLEIVGHWEMDSEYIGISLVNRGIGPAIIKEFLLTYSNQTFNIIYSSSEFMTRLQPILAVAGIRVLNFCTVDPCTYISEGQELKIFFLNKDELEKAVSLFEIFSKVKITVRYESIYGSSFTSSDSYKIKQHQKLLKHIKVNQRNS